MKKLNLLLITAVIFMCTLAGCSVVGDLMKASFYVGIIVVIVVIALLFWLFSLFKGRS
ncbi:MAG: hypothetical protein ABIP28_03465 [Mucilaginibacter sp.]